MKLSPSVRQGSALVGIAGTLLLAGCAAEASSAETTKDTPAPQSTAEASAPAASGTGGTYKDGTYTADGSYQTPETVEKITVSITIAGDTVTAVKVTGDPQASETEHYQSQFIGGISAQVVGKKLDEISVSRVSGSSLTSKGFTQALATIRTEAKS
ncbi:MULTISPECIES: FMN-binding protein [unclassified Microbacterium]|uniref:FMN-binding protein n=1 Tax=unclassified Microbacterium TaxID=2609290 RepID=UPI00203F70CA|nr:FMN-binding protein [Microbacterium sp. USTB-Y]